MKEANSDLPPSNTAEKCPKFKAFLLQSWQPVPSWGSTVVIFLVISAFMFVFGSILSSANSNIQEYTQQYDATCTINSLCSIQISVQTNIQGPIYFYYALDNFYQNHRRYINSFSASQLSGSYLQPSDVSTSCTPIIYNNDLGANRIYAIDGITPLDPNSAAHPCGLVAWSVFNDTYTMMAPNSSAIYLNETMIAWPKDKTGRYKNLANASSTQWIDIENEHFIVWMRTAGLPNFRKLWARIEGNLNVGTYTVNIINNYDVSQFSGKKYIILSTIGPFGGKNAFLSTSYFVVGGICLFISLVFSFKMLQARKQKKN